MSSITMLEPPSKVHFTEEEGYSYEVESIIGEIAHVMKDDFEDLDQDTIEKLYTDIARNPENYSNVTKAIKENIPHHYHERVIQRVAKEMKSLGYI